jgi:hypothetical protein
MKALKLFWLRRQEATLLIRLLIANKSKLRAELEAKQTEAAGMRALTDANTRAMRHREDWARAHQFELDCIALETEHIRAEQRRLRAEEEAVAITIFPTLNPLRAIK